LNYNWRKDFSSPLRVSEPGNGRQNVQDIALDEKVGISTIFPEMQEKSKLAKPPLFFLFS
jgi:hypothetical protein